MYSTKMRVQAKKEENTGPRNRGPNTGDKETVEVIPLSCPTPSYVRPLQPFSLQTSRQARAQRVGAGEEERCEETRKPNLKISILLIY